MPLLPEMACGKDLFTQLNKNYERKMIVNYCIRNCVFSYI